MGNVYTVNEILVGALSDRPVAGKSIMLYVDSATGHASLSDGTTWNDFGFLSGVTSDGAGGLLATGNVRTTRFATHPGMTASTANVEDLFAARDIHGPNYVSHGSTHDGAIGANTGALPLNTFYDASFVGAYGAIIQRIPTGHTITNLSLLTIDLTPGPAVTLADLAGEGYADVFFVADDGSGHPDMNAFIADLRPYGPQAYTLGVKNDTYWIANSPITVDDTAWIVIQFGVDGGTPRTPFFSLDAAAPGGSWPLTQTYTDWHGDGAHLVDIGLQPQLYAAYASDRGFTWSLQDGTVAASLSSAGLALPAMLAENGKTPPASPVAITGTLTSATLAQLTSIVSQLLVALDAKGAITKSTT